MHSIENDVWLAATDVNLITSQKRYSEQITCYWWIYRQTSFLCDGLDTEKYRMVINYKVISLRHNATTRGWGGSGVHLPTRQGPTILAKEVRGYQYEHLPGRWVGSAAATDNTFCTWPPRSPDLTVCDFFLRRFVKDSVYVPPTTSKDTTRIAQSTSTEQSGTSHKTCLRGFGGNGSIAWTSAVSHLGRTSNVFKVAMKLQTFLFQMVVTSRISVRYLWKYAFAKSSDNLY